MAPEPFLPSADQFVKRAPIAFLTAEHQQLVGGSFSSVHLTVYRALGSADWFIGFPDIVGPAAETRASMPDHDHGCHHRIGWDCGASEEPWTDRFLRQGASGQQLAPPGGGELAGLHRAPQHGRTMTRLAKRMSSLESGPSSDIPRVR